MDSLRARWPLRARVAPAQRELLFRVKELGFTDVPALASKAGVRAAVERAGFEHQPLRLTYVDSNFVQSTRDVHIASAMFERGIILLDTVNVIDGAKRQLRLDRIEGAEIIARPEAREPASAPGSAHLRGSAKRPRHR